MKTQKNKIAILMVLAAFGVSQSPAFAMPIATLAPGETSGEVAPVIQPDLPTTPTIILNPNGINPDPNGPCAKILTVENDACSGDVLCTSLMAAIDSNSDGNFLTCGQIVDHVASRLGYGVSPIGPILPATATRSQVRTLIFQVATTMEGKIPLIQSTQLQAALAELVPNQQLSSAGIANANSNYITNISTYSNEINSYTGTTGQAGYCNTTVGTTDPYCENLVSLYKVQFSDHCGLVCADGVTKDKKIEKTLRAVLGSQTDQGTVLKDSQQNLNEVLLEFWYNHFNVDSMKAGQFTSGLSGYEPTLFSKQYTTFKDLLIAAETHPAMLFYLDNETNTFSPTDQSAGNQNLGREMLELHTIGMGPQTTSLPNSPYNQNDVVNVALILTGMRSVFSTTFYGANFNAYEHQPATITVNKQVIPQTPPVVMGKTYDFSLTNYGVGQSTVSRGNLDVSYNGQLTALLTDLANHPRTKLSICRQLSAYFVRTPSLQASNETLCLAAYGVDGDLKSMYAAILTDPNFWSSQNYRTGVQNPLELAVSMARKSGANINQLSLPAFPPVAYNQPIQSFGIHLSNVILAGSQALGLTIRSYTYPTGYPLDGSTWLSKGFLNGAAYDSFYELNLQLSYSPDAQDAIDTKLAELNPSVSDFDKILNQTWGYSTSVSFSNTQRNSCSELIPGAVLNDAFSSNIPARQANLRTIAEYLAASTFGIEK
jgi:hypothetical protein